MQLRRTSFDDDVTGNGYSELAQRQSQPLGLKRPTVNSCFCEGVACGLREALHPSNSRLDPRQSQRHVPCQDCGLFEDDALFSVAAVKCCHSSGERCRIAQPSTNQEPRIDS